MFVPVVAANEFARNTILAPNVEPPTTNTASETVENFDATNVQQNQQNSQKPIRLLGVVPNPAEVCQNDADGYEAAAFVPSKVPRWRSPPYRNILIPEHHITPHMIKVNVMAKLNTA